MAAEAEWEVARAHAVARVVADHPGTVLALGAGHTSVLDDRHRATVRAALAPVDPVVLLLPAADRAESLAVLRPRSLAEKGTDWLRDGYDFLARWLDDPTTREVATDVLVTGDEAPRRTAERVLDLVRTRRGADDGGGALA